MTNFVFTIQEQDGNTRQCLLQGSGGLIGGGCLASLDVNRSPEHLQTVLKHCLLDAQRELEREGSLREYLGGHLPSEQRIQEISPRAVISVELVGTW